MRRFVLLTFLVLVAAAAVGADFVAGRLFESRAQSLIQQRFRLEQEPVVQVRDFPFLLSVARERLNTVDVAADRVRAEDVTLDEVRMNLRDVALPRSVLLEGRGAVTVRRAGGRVRVSEEELSRLLERQVPGARLRLGAGSMRLEMTQQLLGQPVAVALTGTATLDGDRVRFQPRAVRASVPIPPAIEQVVLAGSYSVQVPPLPGDLTVERIVLEPGALVLFATAGPIRLDASGVSTAAG